MTTTMIRIIICVVCFLQMLHRSDCFQTRGLHSQGRVYAQSSFGHLDKQASSSSSPNLFFGHPRINSLSRSITRTSTSIYSNNSNNNNDEGIEDPEGLSRGAAVFFVVFIFNVWLFSIPTEFRRNRFCTEEEVRLYPERNCMTSEMWFNGITNYYQSGGGVQFDFSIENKE